MHQKNGMEMDFIMEQEKHFYLNLFKKMEKKKFFIILGLEQILIL